MVKRFRKFPHKNGNPPSNEPEEVEPRQGRNPETTQEIKIPTKKVFRANKKRHNENMNWKYDLLQIVATALAIAALTVPLLQWGIDSKIEGLEAKLDAMSTKLDARFEQMTTEARATNQRLDDMKDYVNAKTEKQQ